MISKTRYFFAQYNDDPQRHDEIVVGIGRPVGLGGHVKRMGNVLTKSTREIQAFQRFLKKNPIPIKLPTIISTIKITNENRKLIKIQFNQKITTPTEYIDISDCVVKIDGVEKSIKSIENINGDLYITLNSFIYDHQSVSVHYTKD